MRESENEIFSFPYVAVHITPFSLPPSLYVASDFFVCTYLFVIPLLFCHPPLLLLILLVLPIFITPFPSLYLAILIFII